MAASQAPRRPIGDEQRRARLGVRQRLAPASRAADVARAAADVVALHATDPASAMLGARARTRAAAVGDVERALYEERSLVRMLGMRRTVFVVARDVAPLVQACCASPLVAPQRRRFVAQLQAGGVAADGERWLRATERATLAALRRRGDASAAELSEDVPALRSKIEVAPDKPYGGSQGVCPRVLFGLAAAGSIVRGRPAGSWTSSLYRWVPIEQWLADGLPDVDADGAAAELVRRWLGAFGPGTFADLKWWTGWTAGRLRRALAAVAPVEVALHGGATGLVLAGDDEPICVPEPWAALLPALDSVAMGWSQRDWFLGEHRAALFDRSGNIGPTVWWDGRIVGGWAQRRGDGEIVVELLEDAGSDARAAIDDEAQRLAAWIGDDVRVTPRFRTPLERELSA